ncbi:MAG TPA: NAD-binding protein [Solirubrobacteraceae bacterium]|nr:NAD-binding protein [Solirubrobacteraceae bacterium]
MPDQVQIATHHQLRDQRRRARRELAQFTRRLMILLAILAGMIAVGTGGLSLSEHVSPAYGFVWTLDTVTTLGTIPDPHDSAGRVLQVILEVFGIGTLFYALATVAEFFVSGRLSGLIDERRMQKMIDSTSDHYLICGYGRVGRQVVRDLRAAGASYVVIDVNPDNRDHALAIGLPFIDASASDDDVLLQAGIARAQGVIACADSDAENIFITLSARELRADILIVARASAEDSEKKLLRAGADRVISPYKTSGSEMARIALHPQVAMAVAAADYRMEEIDVSPRCVGAGQTIDDVRGASLIVAVRRPDGRLEMQPELDTVLESGDKLLALGTPDAIEALEALFQPVGAQAT